VTVQWFLASAHLLALGIGLGAVVIRAAALGGQLDERRVKQALTSDAAWGIAALLWISTGLLRAFGGYEKGTTYYLESSAFHFKMAALGLILLLEIWPMVTFIRWRAARARGRPMDTARAGLFARISLAQAVLVIFMVFAATAMARGIGF